MQCGTGIGAGEASRAFFKGFALQVVLRHGRGQLCKIRNVPQGEALLGGAGQHCIIRASLKQVRSSGGAVQGAWAGQQHGHRLLSEPR